MNDAEVLDSIRERLEPIFDIDRVVLFGSRVRGDHDAESDYDVLVVARTKLPFVERQQVASRAVGIRPFSVDLLVYTPEELAAEAKVLGTTSYWAELEGKAFYPR